MSFVLGFGSTETACEEAEQAAFAEAVATLYRESGESYFTKEIIEKAGKWLDSRATGYRRKDEEYRTAPSFPDRYSSYYAHVLGDASHIVAVFTFHHTNRRHAMSPDGWALLVTKPCFCIREGDIDVLRAAV